MTVGVPSRGLKCQISPQYFLVRVCETGSMSERKFSGRPSVK